MAKRNHLTQREKFQITEMMDYLDELVKRIKVNEEDADGLYCLIQSARGALGQIEEQHC